MTSNQQASLLRPQVTRLDQLNARRKLQYKALKRRCWKIRNSLPQEEQQSSRAQQTIARTSQALILALEGQMEATRHLQMHRQQGAQSVQQPTQPQAGASRQRQFPQPQTSRIRFNQLMPETQRKVNHHTFFDPPSVVEEIRRAVDGLSDAKARSGQAIQSLQVAETKEEEFQRQAHLRLASGTPLTPPIAHIFYAKVAQCDKAMTDLQTFIENFTAQQNEFRHAPSQRHAQPCPNVAIADSQPFEFFKLPAEIRNMIYQQILHARRPLRFHTSGLFTVSKGNRPDTAIMATCKQMLMEARPLFYSINSFFVGKRAVLSHHLRATPQALRRFKLHTIKHVVLDGCGMLNITRIAELERLRSLETLTIPEWGFARRLPFWGSPNHDIIFDAGRHNDDAINSGNTNIQGEGTILSRVKNLVDKSCYKPTLKSMMLRRPHVQYQVVYKGALDWTLQKTVTPEYLVKFTVSWDHVRDHYIFHYAGLRRLHQRSHRRKDAVR